MGGRQVSKAAEDTDTDDDSDRDEASPSGCGLAAVLLPTAADQRRQPRSNQ